MSLLVPWIVFPLLLGGICLLAGRLVGGRTEPLLWVPLGLATVVVIGGFASLSDPTGELLLGACLLAAAGGAWLRWRDRDRRAAADDREAESPAVTHEGHASARPRGETRWGVATALLAFLVFGAPVLASGEATFAGYIKLDDTATWLALTDHVAAGADDVSELPPSTYEATLSINLGNGYPLGTFAPLALGGLVTGQDPAWLFAPLLSLLAASLALSLFALGRGFVASPGPRAVAAVLASCSALLVGYALWGGIKELLAAALIATAYASAAAAGGRALGLAALCTLALALVLSPAGAAWGAGALLVAAVASGRTRPLPSRRALAGLIAAAVAAAAALGLGGFLSPLRDSFTDSSDLGNLGSPLDPLHLAGVWPAGDFRFPLELPGLSYALIWAVLGLALLGLIWLARERSAAPLAYALATGLVVLAICLVGSPWVDAKAMAVAAPLVPFLAALAAGRLIERGRGAALVGVAALAALAIGIGWSNALAYGGASLAPRDQLAELERVGDLVEGEGPTLITEYQPYGARHFLRSGAAQGASELRRLDVPLRGGRSLGKGEFADLDQLSLAPLLLNRSLVLRRSPVASRPPAPYELAWSGSYYELWQRPEGSGLGSGSPGLHLGFGDDMSAIGDATCADMVKAIDRQEARGGELVAARRAPAVVASLGRAEYPSAWRRSGEPDRPLPREPGQLSIELRVARAGLYELWLRGTIHSLAVARIDGEEVGSARGSLNNSEGWISLGRARVEAGAHEVEIEVRGADLHPGSAAYPEPIGPLALAPVDPGIEVDPLELSPGDAIRCALGGRELPARLRGLDWIELLRD